MKRVVLKAPKIHKRKGLWQYMGKGKKMRFLPACTLSRWEKKYCRPTTRAFLLWEAKLMLGK